MSLILMLQILDRIPVDPTGRFAAVESCCTTAMACMRTLSYGMHVKSCIIMQLCSQLSTALYDPLGERARRGSSLVILRLPRELPRRHGSNAGAPSAPRELPQRQRSSFVQKVGNEGAPSTNVIFSEIIVSCDSCG